MTIEQEEKLIRIAKEKQQQLINAAKTSDLEAVKRLISEGVDVNVRYIPFPIKPAIVRRCIFVSILNPIIFAASNGHAEIVQQLVDAKANVNVTDKYLICNIFDPLKHAILGGHLGVVKILLAAGANPNRNYNEGPQNLLSHSADTPVDIALSLGHNDILAELLKFGALPKQSAIMGKAMEHPEAALILAAHQINSAPNSQKHVTLYWDSVKKSQKTSEPAASQQQSPRQGAYPSAGKA